MSQYPYNIGGRSPHLICQPCESLASNLKMSGLSAPRNNSESGTSKPPDLNKLDCQIQRQNGSTSILEFSRQRIQLAKENPSSSLSARVEELTRELGHLRQEIQFYRQCFEILQRLRETAYEVYQQLFLDHYFNNDSNGMNELISQLHRGLEDSVRREAEAEKGWMEFWNGL